MNVLIVLKLAFEPPSPWGSVTSGSIAVIFRSSHWYGVLREERLRRRPQSLVRRERCVGAPRAAKKVRARRKTKKVSFSSRSNPDSDSHTKMRRPSSPRDHEGASSAAPIELAVGGAASTERDELVEFVSDGVALRHQLVLGVAPVGGAGRTAASRVARRRRWCVRGVAVHERDASRTVRL